MDDKFTLSIDGRVLAGMLLINVAGYDYEQNPAGMHPLRIRLVAQERERLQAMAGILKDSGLGPRDYIRLVNEVVALPGQVGVVSDAATAERISSVIGKVIPELLTYIHSPAFQRVKKVCSDEVEKLPGYSAPACHEHLDAVLDHLQPDDRERLGPIQISINLLDSYRRGTNYVLPDRSILCTSLKFDGTISWSTLRHELVHVVVKRLMGDKYDVSRPEISAEYLVLALQLAIDPLDIRKRGLEGYMRAGFVGLDVWLAQISAILDQKNGMVCTEMLEKVLQLNQEIH